MQTYTLKEAAKRVNVSPSRIKKWEKDRVLETPRTQQGARFYSDADIEIILYIKQLYSSHLSKEAIQDLLQKKDPTAVEPELETLETSISVVTSETRSEIEEFPQNSNEIFFEAMNTYKHNFVNEVKDAIRKELVDKIKEEISKCNLYTVKSLSEAIYKSSANTNEHIQELIGTIEKTNERNADSFKMIEKRISNHTIETSEEFYNMAKELTERTEDLAHYLDLTTKEIFNLTETVEKERNYYVKDREQFRHDLRQRERAFQNMLADFRESAASKENRRKWWKIW